jgi:phosphonate transport system substrate-binding protein
VSIRPSTVLIGISRGHGDSNVVPASHAFSSALESVLGDKVALRVAPTYAALYEMFTSGGVDVAWLPPLLTARALAEERGANGGHVLVAVPSRHGATSYRSALIVARESRFTKPSELLNARAAWIDRDSAAGYVFPRAHLREHGIGPGDLADEAFVRSAGLVCSTIADGRADVGATHVSEAAAADPEKAFADLERQFAPARWRLRVLSITAQIPPDGVVVAEHVDRQTKERFREAILGLHERKLGEHAITSLFNAERFVEPTSIIRGQLSRARGLADLV